MSGKILLLRKLFLLALGLACVLSVRAADTVSRPSLQSLQTQIDDLKAHEVYGIYKTNDKTIASGFDFQSEQSTYSCNLGDIAIGGSWKAMNAHESCLFVNSSYQSQDSNGLSVWMFKFFYIAGDATCKPDAVTFNAICLRLSPPTQQ